MRLVAGLAIVVLTGGLAGVVLAGGPASEDERCKYAGQFFAPDAVACQSGRQFRCVGGAWQAVGADCGDDNAAIDQPALLVDPSDQAPAVPSPGTPAEPPVPHE